MRYEVKDIIEYVLVRIFIFVLRLLPYKLSFFIGEQSGNILYLLDKKHGEIARDNLRKAFKGEKNEEEIENIIKNIFRNIGRCFVEFIYLPKFSDKKLRDLVKIDGVENLHNAFNKKKGVIVIVSHFGNWELVGATFPLLYPNKSSAIAFPQGNALTDKLINNIRRSKGLKVIYTGPSVKNVLKSLYNNEIVGFLADQDAGGSGLFVDFFGRKASTAKGPITLALKTQSPLVMVFITRENKYRHRMVITEELKLDITGDTEKDIFINTQKWVRILESYIRKYPSEWFWVHRRWKSGP